MTTHEEQERMDGRLRSFFRGEMPEPWPEFRYPTTPRAGVSGASQATLSWARCIVAVCLALFFGLYLGLAHYFRPASGPTVTPNQDMIGSRPGAHKVPSKSLDIVPMPMRK